MEYTVRIQVRADTAANWTAANPVLLRGEIGKELDTRLEKVGDGATPWNGLGYCTVRYQDLVDIPITSVSWNDIGSKPTEFTPIAHSHDWSAVDNKPTEFTPIAHSHDWSAVDNKPTEFTPIAHSHDASDVTGNFSYVDVDPAAGAPAHQEGRMYYDPTSHSLSYYCDIVGSSLQIGQEQWVRVRNNSGTTIVQGEVVKLSGAQGQTPTVTRARSDVDSNYDALGVATSDMANNAVGLVTVFGIINNMDTSAWVEGAPLYLSSTVSGALTDVVPAAPNNPVAMGACVYSHANNGKIFVRVLAAGVNDDQIKVDAETYSNVLSTADTSLHTVLDKLDNLVVFSSTAPSGAPATNQRFLIKTTEPIQLYTASGGTWKPVGVSVDGTPSNGNTLTFNSTSSTWIPSTPAAGGLTLGKAIALMG